jgi:predicted amidohydrolase YtcJ
MTGPPPLLLRDVEVRGRRTDVRVRGARVHEVAPGLRASPGEQVVDGAGGALLPGLHDHHVHLAAVAAAAASVPLGPPAVRSPGEFDRAVGRAHAAAPDGVWLRGVGQDDAASGPVDRHRLDVFAPGRPVRVQHASGHRWVLSSTALDLLGLRGGDGVEAGEDGQPTGRVFGRDAALRGLPLMPPPDLAAVGAALLRLGVTSVSDLTATSSQADLDLLGAAVREGLLPQAVYVSGGPALARHRVDGVEPGPVKLVLADHDLPGLDDLREDVRTARAAGRTVAVHTVTRASATLALAALAAEGAVPGDRIEHGSMLPSELMAWVASLGLTVVTQPSFVGLRGDTYLDDVDPDDVPHLYPVRSLLAAGVRTAFSSDAPFGDLDPWRGIRDAVARRTPSGRVVGAGECLDAGTALAAYLGAPDDPGGPPRRVRPGVPADLCLLTVPLRDALSEPSAEYVRLTLVRGRVYGAG